MRLLSFIAMVGSFLFALLCFWMAKKSKTEEEKKSHKAMGIFSFAIGVTALYSFIQFCIEFAPPS